MDFCQDHSLEFLSRMALSHFAGAFKDKNSQDFVIFQELQFPEFQIVAWFLGKWGLQAYRSLQVNF